MSLQQRHKPKPKQKKRSTPVELMLIGKGMKKYGRDLKAVKSLYKASDSRHVQEASTVASTSKAVKTSAEQEFHSSESEFDIDSDSDWKATENDIFKKDTRYTNIQGSQSREEILSAVKNGDDAKDQADAKSKRKKSQRGKQTAKSKMSSILESLPALIQNANSAAKRQPKTIARP
ncbi:uncharacterized protein LOC116287589 [Actinia tenebrosa]|uniref:Uncharacterized protein LOC116287589 n=1 Tax=Actinia tenebrosa TaxID=6105 RepID=A0A6P8H3F6_ACTTE|nr:uncharacterized protein LOC116287589 [Actinia tenebrosa]